MLYNPNSESTPIGTSLLKSLIDSSVVVTIGLSSSFNADPTRSISGNILAMRVGYGSSLPQLFESSGGKLQLIRVDSAIALGHELIHAHRNIESSREPLPRNYTSITYDFGDGLSVTKEESLEELIVIGNRPGSAITENELRREQGMLPRFGHDGRP